MLDFNKNQRTVCHSEEYWSSHAIADTHIKWQEECSAHKNTPLWLLGNNYSHQICSELPISPTGTPLTIPAVQCRQSQSFTLKWLSRNFCFAAGCGCWHCLCVFDYLEQQKPEQCSSVSSNNNNWTIVTKLIGRNVCVRNTFIKFSRELIWPFYVNKINAKHILI